MTTSTPPPNSAPVSTQETKLTDERAVTIGWFFIHSYYDFYNNKIENIHKIYNKLASISHSKFPNGEISEETNEIYKAKGIEAIKLRFKNDDVLQKNSNRIVITNAAFEVSLDKNLLIVVYGEWSKNNSQYYQFTQTFLLTPAAGANDERFDVANDILRFNEVDNVIKSIESTKEPVKEEPKTTETKAEVSHVESKPQSKAEPKKDIQNDEPVKQVTEAKAPESKVDESKVDESKEETREPSVKQEEIEPVVAKSETQPNKAPIEEIKQSTPEVPPPKSSENSKSSTPSTTSTPITSAASTTSPPTKPAAPLSWAALASQAASQTAPKSTKSNPIPTSIPTPAVSKAQPPKKLPTTPTTNKFKKEEWFPIYIRGVKSINEKRLRDVLSKSFGELKFFRTNLDIALVDFVTQEAQQEALNSKEIKIDGISISLEPRGSKTGNNFHNAGKKQKDQKPQQFQSSPSDLKRTKSEKKPNNTNTNPSKKSNTPKKD